MLSANTKLLDLHDYYKKKLNGVDISKLSYQEKEPFFVAHDLNLALEDVHAAFAYFKPYQDFETGRVYYNEREWRATIPYNEASNFEVPVIFPDRYPELLKQKDDILKIIEEKYMLIFHPEHIKYIIVNDESDIEDVISCMNNLPDKYSKEDVAKLTTRILTCQQIHEDF